MSCSPEEIDRDRVAIWSLAIRDDLTTQGPLRVEPAHLVDSGADFYNLKKITRALRCAHIGKKDRPQIDPFSIHDAEVLITALHADWGEAPGNYDEFRFFTGLRPSEEIALVVTDYDRANRILSVTKARVDGIDKDCTKARCQA